MTVRLTCLVPFCRRTRGRRRGEKPFKEGAEWICGPHWRAVSRRTKFILSRCRRRSKREGWTDFLGGMFDRTWAKAKTQAIEAAAGIA